MRRVRWLIFSLIVFSLGLGAPDGAAFIIYDTAGEAYWGKVKPGYSNADVFGGPSFDFTRMEVSFSGEKMKVQIFGDFTNPDNRQGDLFLSSKGWKALGTGPHYIDDTFTKEEGWDYVVSSSVIPDSTNGVHAYKGLWVLDWGSLLETSSREDQPYAKDAGGVWLRDAAVTFASDSLTFEFLYTGLGSLGPDSFGVHFTQACGNDIIEGGTPTAPVPIPPTLYLSLTGLIGFILMRKKIFR